MAGKVRAFRGLIYSQFDSESDFARALGWPRQAVNKLSNGIKQPDLEEIDAMAKVLNVSELELMHIFLAKKSPNRQRTKAGTYERNIG